MQSAPSASDHDPAAHRAAKLILRPLPQLLLLLAVCGLIYWTNLGASGFSSTEGHRAIPGWEMLGDRAAGHGDNFITTLFERPYLRKPPGMPWAIAVSSMIFGQTEFAARAVSATAATLAALVMLGFGRRWFGPVGGLAAGLAQALMPRWWSPGRSAEIEMLNNFGTLLAIVALADLVVLRHRSTPASRALVALLAAAGIVIAGLAKGPASLPVLVGLFFGTTIVFRSPRPLFKEPIAIGLASGLAVVAAVLAIIAFRSRGLADPPVMQNVSEFLWKSDQVLKVLGMPFVALGSAMPASLALLFPWGPDARAEVTPDRPRAHIDAWRLGFVMTWSCLLGIAVLFLVGVNNPRYAMPVLTPISAVVGYVAYGTTGWFVGLRTKIAIWMNLGWRWGWPAVLVLIAGYFVAVSEPQREQSSGRSAGITLAASLPDHCELWADALVEARPEVIQSAIAAAQAQGRSVRARWISLAKEPDWSRADPAARVFVLLRDDNLGNEWSQALSDGWAQRLVPITTGTAHKYSYRLLEHQTQSQSKPTE